MEKNLLEMAVQIVQAQASMSRMAGEEIEQALVRVYNALHKMKLAEEQGLSILQETLDGHIPSRQESSSSDPRSSIQEDKVTCMECKAEFRQLTANHLRTHHLTPREYKKKWGFPLKQPLAARVLTKLRSKSAKKRGLPEKLQIYLDQKRKGKTASSQDMLAEVHAPERSTYRGTL
ncbi:MAG: MucR family transcriptional regulator [Syntrophobacteraceae bacterium]